MPRSGVARVFVVAMLGFAFSSYALPIWNALPNVPSYGVALAGNGSGKDKMNWAQRRREFCKKNPADQSCIYIIAVKSTACTKTNVAHYKNSCSAEH